VLEAGVLEACRLKLVAWRLQLGAYAPPREARHNILGV